MVPRDFCRNVSGTVTLAQPVSYAARKAVNQRTRFNPTQFLFRSIHYLTLDVSPLTGGIDKTIYVCKKKLGPNDGPWEKILYPIVSVRVCGFSWKLKFVVGLKSLARVENIYYDVLRGKNM